MPLLLPGCASKRATEVGPPAPSAAGRAFVTALARDWNARAQALSTLSGSVKVTVAPPAGKGAARSFLAVLKFREPSDFRAVLLADYLTLADLLLTPSQISLYVPPAEKAYRGKPAGGKDGEALARSVPEMRGLDWVLEAGRLRHVLAGVVPLPSAEDLLVTPSNRSGTDWMLTARDGKGAPAQRMFVRAEDRALVRAEFLAEGRARVVLDADDFRKESAGSRAYRWTLSAADAGGSVVLQFQQLRRNETLGEKSFVQDLPDEASVVPLEALLSDRERWEEELTGGAR